MSNATKSQQILANPPKNRFWAAMRRGFGDRYFVKTFWKLLIPTLVWGVLISIVPILFNSVTKIALDYSSSGGVEIHGDLSSPLNYTYEEFSTVNYLATIFIFSFFPAIGNYFGHKNYEDFKQTLRFATYLSMTSSLIMFVCYETCAEGYIDVLVFDGTGVSDKQNAQEILGIHLVRPMSFIVFSFAWQWLYIPALSSIKNNRPLIYSAILGIIFYIIADVTYLFATIRPEYISALQTLQHQGESAKTLVNAPLTIGTTPFAVEERAAVGEGIIYTVYFFIQPLFVYLYLKFFRSIQIMWFWFKGPMVYWRNKNKPNSATNTDVLAETNAYYSESNYNIELKLENPLDRLYNGSKITTQQIDIIKQTYYFEKEVLFFNKLSVRNDLMRAVVVMSVGNIVDQALFNAIEIVHFYYAIHYNGSFDAAAAGTIDGLPAIKYTGHPGSAHDLASAAHHYFKLLVYVPEQMIVFFYGIWNAFFVVPQFFVARELGMRHKDIAKRNAWICMNWAYLISFVLMIMIWIFSSFINEYVTYVNNTNNPNAYYAFKHGEVMYKYLWQQSRDIMLYFGLLQITYTAALMAMPIVITGASKWIVFSDTVGTTLFTIIGVILNKTHFDGVAAYWFIVHLDKLFKYTVFMIIMLTGSALNSIHDTNSKNSRLPSKQWKILNNTIPSNNVQIEPKQMVSQTEQSQPTKTNY